MKKSFFAKLLSRALLAKMSWDNKRESALGEYVSKVFSDNWFYRRIAPLQIESEIRELLEILEKYNVKSVLEIGTANGGTLLLFSRVVASNALLVSIDLSSQDIPCGYSDWREDLYRGFATKEQTIKLVRGDSRKKETYDTVCLAMGDSDIEFLFIDGDHSYEGVKNDWELYSKKLSPRGIVAFHDIVPGPESRVGGVPQFWHEVKNEEGFEAKEIIEQKNQGGFGLGVLLRKNGPG